MLGTEEDAAILIGKNRGLVGTDLPRQIHDLLLVHTDERTEDQLLAEGIAEGKPLEGLAGHLAQRFAGDDALAADLLGVPVGQRHHRGPEHQRRLVLQGSPLDLQLGLREVRHPQARSLKIGGDEGGEGLHLFKRLVARIRVGVEVEAIHLHSPLSGQESRDGAVQPSAEQKQSFAGAADRKPSEAFLLRRIQVCLVPDLTIQNQIGVLHIDGEVGMDLMNRFRQLDVQLVARQREALVRPPADHLEGAFAFGKWTFADRLPGRFMDRLQFLGGAE